MADNTHFVIKEHDLVPSFRAQCRDGATPVDLTAATGVRFLLRSRSSASTPLIAAAATKEDQVANAGWVHYDWQTGDTASPGLYFAEVEVTWPGGKTQTFPADGYGTVSVVSDLG